MPSAHAIADEAADELVLLDPGGRSRPSTAGGRPGRRWPLGGRLLADGQSAPAAPRGSTADRAARCRRRAPRTVRRSMAPSPWARQGTPARYRDLVHIWRQPRDWPRDDRGDDASAGRRYLAVGRRAGRPPGDQEWPRIEAAAALMAEALATGHVIHAFGSGHSHMLAEELFYRAGGLVRVRPILFEGLMLHASAPLSTALERMPGLAAALLADHPMARRRRAHRRLQLGRQRRDHWSSRGWPGTPASAPSPSPAWRHATSPQARVSDGPRLHEVADVVIDNGGVVGDAAVEIDGLASRVAPTSTVVGAAIVEALVAEVVERLVARGIVPEVYASSNVAGGDAANARFGRPAEQPG